MHIQEQEKAGPKGTLIATLVRKDGTREKVWEKEIKNLITFLGVAHVAGMLFDTTTYPKFTHGQIGSNTDAAVDGDNRCKTSVQYDAATGSRVTTTITNDTAQFVSSHNNATAGAWAIAEYCLVTGISGGTGLNRVVFASIAVPIGDTLEFTYKVQIQRV